MVVVGKKECLPLFVHNVCFRQMPLTRLSIKRRWSLSHNITNLSQRAPFIYSRGHARGLSSAPPIPAGIRSFRWNEI